MREKLTTFLIIILVTGTIQAQEWQLLKTANASFEQSDYYSAIPVYEDIVRQNPSNVEAWFKLGESYHFSRNHKQAVKAYAKLLRIIGSDKNAKKKYFEAYYHNGNSLMAVQDYEEAKKSFHEFLRIRQSGNYFRGLKRQASAHMSACKKIEELTKMSYLEEYRSDRLPETVNNPHTDFAPIWMDKQTLLFSSLRADSALKISSEERFVPAVQIYKSKKVAKGWEGVQAMDDFNHDFFHTANGTFSQDGKTFVFSICQENKDHEIRCHLYASNKTNAGWQKPVKLKGGINQASSTATQPAFGQYRARRHNYEVLYFVSDREGGRGGTDLWYSTKDKKGTWSKPFNCGSAINTSGDEISPYFDQESSTLYFSSDYHAGLGGHDVFSTTGAKRSWRRVENMGPSINSSYDDMYFSWRNSGIDGTLVSNRDGSASVIGDNCCDDIYMVEKQPTYMLNGITMTVDSIRLPNVSISVFDSLIQQEPVHITSTDEQGLFDLPYLADKELGIIAALDAFKTVELSFTGSGHQDTLFIILEGELTESQEVLAVKNEEATNQEVLSEQSLNASSEEGAVYVMENMYFEFDKAGIHPKAYKDLELLEKYLKNNPKVRIEIAGHTDSKGDEQHNHDLSQRRADAIKKHLVKNGIYKKRISAVGYGEERPIAPNENEDGSDNPEGRKLNRRTEVIILSR